MEDPAFTADDFAEADQYSSLGPAYFAAQRVCREAMAAFEADHMRPLVENAAKAFQDELWSKVEDYLWSDTESNLQGRMWRMVDEMVEALLGGREWALKRYALGDRHDHQAIRAAIAKLIPAELQDARVADLEAKVAQLEKDIRFYRER